MAFGRISGRGQCGDVLFEVEPDRVEFIVHKADDFFDARGRLRAHRVRELAGAGRNFSGVEAEPEMVGDAGFSGRVDRYVGQLLEKHARFDSAGVVDVEFLGAFAELLDGVEHVEVDDPGRQPAGLLREVGDIRRRIVVAVVAVTGVTVHVVQRAGRFGRQLAVAAQFGDFGKCVFPDRAVGRIEFQFKRPELLFADHRHPPFPYSLCCTIA